MFYKPMVRKYRTLKKKSYLETLNRPVKQYAFLGVGEHSINNLYPCLQHLNVNLKYIYSRTLANARFMSQRFMNCEATDNPEKIFADTTIDSVLICVTPDKQFELAVRALRAGKKVFIEKPPCSSLEELQQLIKLSADTICFPGLQRRFSTINRLLYKYKLLQNAQTYRYTFKCGGYPEGDTETEILIHAIDNIIGLFGDWTDVQVKVIRSVAGLTYHLQLQHTTSVFGQIELSTQFSWNNVEEVLEVNGTKHSLTAAYPNSLLLVEKSRVLGLPAEKFFKGPLETKTFLDGSSYIPSLAENNLVMQGFYGEVYEFVQSCETGKWKAEYNIQSLSPVYRLIAELKRR